jgi:hypothetical protein
MTARWTNIATARFRRKRWPEVIFWSGRAFVKATTGKLCEEYVERSALYGVNVTERRTRANAHAL